MQLLILVAIRSLAISTLLTSNKRPLILTRDRESCWHTGRRGFHRVPAHPRHWRGNHHSRCAWRPSGLRAESSWTSRTIRGCWRCCNPRRRHLRFGPRMLGPHPGAGDLLGPGRLQYRPSSTPPVSIHVSTLGAWQFMDVILILSRWNSRKKDLTLFEELMFTKDKSRTKIARKYTFSNWILSNVTSTQQL